MGLRSLLVIVLAATVLAQEPPRPTFRTEANYVRVDVYPTQGGAPVDDLTQDDFAVLDNGVPQRIEQFEHVLVRGNIPQELRRDPNTVAESREALQNPRARVFVIFLDTGHVDVGGSHNIRQPLIDMLNRLIGEEDLVAVMTPDMSARDLAFARKTTTIEGLLTRYWTWGDRDRVILVDPVEQAYQACYEGDASLKWVAEEMIARRREKQTLDALEDLVVYLRGAREERKAVIAITEGWRLYGLNRNLADAVGASGAAPPPIGLDPGGRLTIGDSKVPGTLPVSRCNTDRLALAQLDDGSLYQRILDEGNRANTSFYPVEPRGLVAFDSSLQNPVPPPGVDRAILQRRTETLRTLAGATDGMAIIQNDITRGLRRIVDDLSSYYLLGYYASGKLDGKFHAIAVRVKRPGIDVRARRGYLAATPDAVRLAAGAPRESSPATVDPAAAAVTAAVASLANFAREAPLRVQAAVGWKPGDASSAFVAVEGELSAAREFEDAWKGGAQTTIELVTNDGASLANTRLTVDPGARTFRAMVVPAQPLAPGEYVLRIGARANGATVPTRDMVRITLQPRPHADGAIWFRRGPGTANRDVATADLRFRRSEQVRVEIPTVAASAGPARLLDRTGKALAIPVASAVRDEADGSRWTTAQLALAPLAVGDYVIELAEGNNRMLAAFRIVP